MASKGDVKGFFRRTKKSAGITKPSSASSKTKSSQKSSTPKHAASLGSGAAQPPALISHGGSLDLQDDYDGNEEVLRKFDMNMAYGACVGMSRMARWERASKLAGEGEFKSIKNAKLIEGTVRFGPKINLKLTKLNFPLKSMRVCASGYVFRQNLSPTIAMPVGFWEMMTGIWVGL